MNCDKLLRRALWFSVFYNLGAAYLFAFPASAPGRLAQMPAPVPPLYCGLLAMFVAEFGGVYAWLALSKTINRPVLAVTAIGKSCAFTIILVLWLAGAVPATGPLSATGDAVLAGIFFWWLTHQEEMPCPST
jgi:hypothetical protein